MYTGQFFLKLKSLIQPKANRMNKICPSSTPILKKSRAEGIVVCGRPISVRAPANPKPCNNPNENATTHGYVIVNDFSPLLYFSISIAKNTILKAIMASTGAPGSPTNPKAESDKVIL